MEHPEGANVRPVNLGDVAVGGDNPPYIVAEVGSNHNGDMDLCRRLIDAAAEAGANAVKFQSWSETSLIANEEYERNPTYADKKKHFGSLRDMVRAYQLTPEQHVVARDHARERGIAFCSSAFSPAEADLLAGLDVPFIKIASMDVTNLPLLAHVAGTGKPLVISVGMATLGEIDRAMETVRSKGNEDIILLHCVSIYPAPPSTVHLRNLETLRRAFDVPVGFSDHTMGTAIPVAAIALGACMIEKHFTLDKEMEGWDHAISCDPAELRAVVEDGRIVHEALGSTRRMLSEAEIVKRGQFRRSLVVRAALPAGHVLTEADLDAKRPGTGIGPDELQYVVGRTLATDLTEDQVLRWDHLR
jgi:N,N'-diacetyllegionaminate synthase